MDDDSIEVDMNQKIKRNGKQVSSLGRENLPFNDSSEKPCILICAHCMEKFQTKTQLKDHYRRFHKEFMDHNSSNQKRLVRKLNRHMCGICSKHFADFWTLKHHQKTVHQAAREHKCPNCTKCFLSNKDMVRHFKGVHLGQKIVFPGGRKKMLSSSENIGNHIDCNAGSKSDSSEKKMVPNILKSSKCEKKNICPTQASKKEDHVMGQANKVIGIEKTPYVLSTEIEVLETNTSWPINGIRGDELVMDGESNTKFPVQRSPAISQHEEPPVFRLENLENLQFVLPEGSKEPQIIIPEAGITLTIPGSPEALPTNSTFESEVLHIAPNQVEEVNPDKDEHISPIINYIPIIENTNEVQVNVPEQALDQLEIKEKTVHENSMELDIDSNTVSLDKLEFPKKFVYKKISGKASTHLVAIKEMPIQVDVTTVQQFKCDFCNKFFISKDFLDNHIKVVHADLTLTSIFSGNLEGLSLNNDDHNLSNFHDLDFSFSEDLESQPFLKTESQDSIASNCAKISCKVCGVCFADKAAFSNHKKLAHKRPQSFKCEQCGSEFTSKQTLKSHIQSLHEGIKKVCSFCLKPVADLARHIRTQHKNEGKRDFACDLCPMNFRTNFSLQRHKETVHLKVKAWVCDLCEKSFGEKRDMIRHKNAIHFGIKNKQSKWTCPECKVIFKLRRDYDQHKTMFHPNLTEEQVVEFLYSEMQSKKQKFQVTSFKM